VQETFIELKQRAKALGFADLWVTDASPFADWERAVGARGSAYSLQADPRAVLPSARRVVVLAYPYHDEADVAFPQVGVSAYYLASHRAYNALPALADWLKAQGWQAVARPGLPVKPAALRAGAGRYGRNGLLITEAYGGNTALGLLLTDAELPLNAPSQMEGDDTPLAPECQNCSACVRACPVGALDGTSAVDTARCLRAHMFGDGPAPAQCRETMGNRFLGCDDCRRICPCSIRAKKNDVPAQRLHLTLDALLGPDETRREALEQIEEKVGGNYARPNRALAQAALLAGNSGDARYLPALVPLCESDHVPLREHARWAVEKLRAESLHRCGGLPPYNT